MPATMDVQEIARYPIGHFTEPTDVSAPQRAKWIDQIAALPSELRAASEDLGDIQLETPYREGGWTVRQVVHHVADSHLNAFIRFKLALTEDTPTIVPYQEALWAQLPDVAATPIAVSLDLIEALHARWVNLLRAMTDADFARGFYHPEYERVQLLGRTAAMYAWHGKHHTAHITRLRDRNGW